MLETADIEQLKKGLPTLWLIWGGMVVSLLLYLAVFNLAEIETRKFAPELLDLMQTIFVPLAAFSLLFSVWLRKRMLAGKSAARTTQARPVADTPPLVLGRYLTTMMICLALCESVGIYGFVLVMLGAPMETLYLFVAVGILGMLYFRPRLDDLETLALRQSADGGD